MPRNYRVTVLVSECREKVFYADSKEEAREMAEGEAWDPEDGWERTRYSHSEIVDSEEEEGQCLE